MALSILCAGCDMGTEIRYVDPAIVIDESYFIEPVKGDPTVLLGLYEEQLFDGLEEGEELPVVWGLQGGHWTMPCIRTVGIASRATVDCTVIMDDGEMVGKTKAKTNFFLTASGYLEYQSFPIPIEHEADAEAEIDDLYDRPATLDCSVTDDEERGNQLSIGLIVTKG